MDFITTKTIELLTFRIQQEQYSSKVYEQMAQWLQNESYLGMAKVWEMFSKEELEHAEMAKEYLLSFNVMPELMVIEEPINVFKDITDIINKTYDHEVLVTNQCLDLSKYALSESDFNLFTLSQKYNAIQVKEMDEVNNLKDIVALSTDKLIIDNYIKENFLG